MSHATIGRKVSEDAPLSWHTSTGERTAVAVLAVAVLAVAVLAMLFCAIFSRPWLVAT